MAKDTSISLICDDFLKETSILSHDYGIPPIKRAAMASTRTLEVKYYELHQELTTKLNRLMYLNKMQDLNEWGDEVDTDYELVKATFFQIDPNDLELFLRTQIDRVKSQQLLNNYLQKVLPILRSIHHSNADLSSVELNIQANLEKLYLLEDGLVFKVMEADKQNTAANELLAEKNKELTELVGELTPHLDLLTTLSKDLIAKSEELNKIKQEPITTASQMQKNQIRDSYRKIVKSWNTLSKTCEFLTIFVTSLPINWYNNRDLFDVIKDCEALGNRMARYQLIINISNFNNFSLDELVGLDFDELIDY